MGLLDFLKTPEERAYNKMVARRKQLQTSSGTPPTGNGMRPLPPKTPTEHSYRCEVAVRRNLAQQASVKYGETPQDVKDGIADANRQYGEATSASEIDSRRRKRSWFL